MLNHFARQRQENTNNTLYVLNTVLWFFFKIQTILHEPNEQAYLEFYVTVDSKEVNRTDVVETFRVSNVNLLTAQLGVQVITTNFYLLKLSLTESKETPKP